MADSKLTEFVLRPKTGQVRSGRTIRVRTNFFEVKHFPDQNIIHYDVTVTPDVPPSLNRQVFQRFEDTFLTTTLGNVRAVYDSRKNIFAPRPYPFGEAEVFDVILPEEEGPLSGLRKRAPREFKLKIKKAAEINMKELHLYINAEKSLTANCLTGITALDILIHHRPSMMYSTAGRSFYTPAGSRELSNGIETWSGFYQSVRPTPKKMMVVVDVSTTPYHQPGLLTEKNRENS